MCLLLALQLLTRKNVVVAVLPAVLREQGSIQGLVPTHLLQILNRRDHWFESNEDTGSHFQTKSCIVDIYELVISMV